MAQTTYKLTKSTATFTRSAVVTAYPLNQVISNGSFLVFSMPDRAAYLRKVMITIDAIASGTNLRLHLFNSNPVGIVTAIADYSTLALPPASFLIYEGSVDIGIGTAGGLGSGVATSAISNLMVPSTGDIGVIYGLLVAITTYTPTALSNIRTDLYYETAN